MSRATPQTFERWHREVVTRYNATALPAGALAKQPLHAFYDDGLTPAQTIHQITANQR
jgi:hypothetical protein